MHWLGWVLLAAMVASAAILIGAFRHHNRMMKQEDQRTHRERRSRWLR